MGIYDRMSADSRHLPMVLSPPRPERFWRKLARTLTRIPFAEDLVAVYVCALDRETPTYVRAVLFGAVAYFILPADAVPDILAGLGYTDDATVIAAAIAAVGRHLTPEHRAEARAKLDRLGGSN
jgi:uncharacterized membrane protein YkvA (DUF1232 family)